MKPAVEFFDTRADTWEMSCYPPPSRERLDALAVEFGVQPGERILFSRHC